MGGEVLSAFLQVLVQNLAEELRLVWGVVDELRKLRDDLSMIQAVLSDAEERQHTDEAVKLWLNDLRGVAYDANDVLDEFATEVRRRDLIPHAGVRNSLSSLNPQRALFSLKMSHKIKDIADRLDVIAKRRNNFSLRVGDGAARPEQRGDHRQTTSLNPSSPLGRESDKQRILELLVSSRTEQNISVISIHGMGGIGKTTLAQLVYNDEIVERYFELRLWVHVSYDFNVHRLTKAMIESIESCVYHLNNLDNLQRHLKEKLAEKRYLLVLDDVWNDDPQEWQRLKVPLLYGARGSKILVTTRSEEVVDMMSTSSTNSYSLRDLSDDDCWSLFCQNAFDPDSNAFSDPDSIGRVIVSKCKGLPLAAIALGHRLRRVADRSRWEAILQDEDWEFSGGNSDISRAVSSSYQQLPEYLKPCFAYCSLIPKGCEFEKEFIIQLWIAQNFIRSSGGERIEDIGSSYFDSLVRRSFFQFSHFDYKSGQKRYTMHSLIHSYAQRVSAQECCIEELGKQSNISPKTRHATLIYNQLARDVSTQSKSIFETIFDKSKGLYTLLLAGGSAANEIRFPSDLANRFGSIRTLDLTSCGVSMLPESIGDLIHLRCLQLRNTTIRRLPESVSRLYNLLILGLRNCDILELPRDMRNLRKLRHLDLHLDQNSVSAEGAMSGGHSLSSMPPEIGLLTDLQTLSRFVVSERRRCGITQLRNMNNLHGELQISNLQFVSNAAKAKEANLAGKKYIHRLGLRWSYPGGVNEERVLHSLQPHTNLRELSIIGYGGVLFPNWIGHSSFSNLVIFSLCDCKKCEILPPFGHLPVLKELYIKRMGSVKTVDCSFCGQVGRNFQSLQKLHFESMRSLQQWCGNGNCFLPSLSELVIKDCTDLQHLTHNLPSLKKLEIEGCTKLVGLRSFPSLRHLEVKACGEWVFGSWPNCDQLASMPDDCLPACLAYLEIKHCPQLLALPNGLQRLRKLEELEVHNCEQLKYLPDGLKNLTSLMRLEISDCPQLMCLPSDGLPAKLQFLRIDNCPELRLRCQAQGGQDWPKIEHIFSVWIDKQPVVSSVQPPYSSDGARSLYQGQSSGQ